MKRLIALALLVAAPALGQINNGWQELPNGWGEIQAAAGPVPAGCTAGSVALFLGSPVAMGCDAALTYTTATLAAPVHAGTTFVAAQPATITITGSTNATPIVVTATAHGLRTNDRVSQSGFSGNTNANGYFKVTRLSADTYSLQNPTTGADIAGNGAHGGTPVAVTGIVQAGRVLFANGTAAMPSMSFANAPTEGFYSTGSGISFSTAGVRRGMLQAGNLYLTQDFNKGVVVGESSDAGIWGIGTAAWSIGTGTAGDYSGSLKHATTILATPNGATWTQGFVTELTTIANAAYTDTTINLPANAVIRAVVGRVNVAPPGTATMSVGDPTTAGRFATGVSTALNTTFVGFVQADQTGAPGPRQTTTAKVRYTPNTTPSDATGRVRTVVYYDVFVPPTS